MNAMNWILGACLISGCAGSSNGAQPATGQASSGGTTTATTTAAGPATPEPASMTVDQVAASIEHHDGTFVYDANGRQTYLNGHVPGAHWVDARGFAATELPSDHAATLVFYCGNESCGASHVAARRAEQFGYTHVAVMPAGIAGWNAAGKPTVHGENPL